MNVLEFGCVDGVGVFVKTACEVAEACGEGGIFLGSELAFLVVDSVAVDLLGEPALRLAEIVASEFGDVDAAVELEECDPYGFRFHLHLFGTNEIILHELIHSIYWRYPL